MITSSAKSDHGASQSQHLVSLRKAVPVCGVGCVVLGAKPLTIFVPCDIMRSIGIDVVTKGRVQLGWLGYLLGLRPWMWIVIHQLFSDLNAPVQPGQVVPWWFFLLNCALKDGCDSINYALCSLS